MGVARHRDTLTHSTDLHRVARDTLALSAPSLACKPTPAAAAETHHRALQLEAASRTSPAGRGHEWRCGVKAVNHHLHHLHGPRIDSFGAASPRHSEAIPDFHVPLGRIRRSLRVDGRNVAINRFVCPPDRWPGAAWVKEGLVLLARARVGTTLVGMSMQVGDRYRANAGGRRGCVFARLLHSAWAWSAVQHLC
jgi:hypothetical protein